MVLGVDVGGTKVAVAAVDGVTARTAVSTRPSRPAPTRCSTAWSTSSGGDPQGRRARGDRRRRALADRVRDRDRRDEREHPAGGRPLREELGRRFDLPVFVDNDANCAALAEAHIVGERDLGDAHARHGRRRRRGHRRHDLPRRARPRRRARAHHRESRRASLPGQLPQPRLPRGVLLRPGARARRAPSWRATRPTARSPTGSTRTATCPRRELVAAADGDPDALRCSRTSRACSDRDRELRERLRALPARHRRRALARFRTSSSTARSRRRAPARSRALGSASTSRSPRAGPTPA